MHTSQTDSVATAQPAWFVRLLERIRVLLGSITVRRRERSLRLCETLPLGEKRFLAVVQIEGRRFLIGATNQSIALLDRLDSVPTQRPKRESLLESSFLNGVH
ncbi:MAG: flagellar biosynthetic protein FliO [Candidatus Acidiferrum sp.]